MLQLYLQLLETEEEQRDFSLLYETYQKLMHWVAIDILHDDSLAEDAVQEAFLRIIKNFQKINEILCPETKNFVVIIVKNVALTMQSKKTRDFENCISLCAEEDTLNESEDSLHAVLESMSGKHDETVDAFLAQELKLAMEQLPEKLREVLFLYGYLGYHMREISAYLGISEATAHKRLQRARNMIARIWMEKGR